MSILQKLSLGLIILFSACAIITVNIYFPEKDVEQAYKNLEEELLKGPPPGKKEEKPQSLLNDSIRGLLNGIYTIAELFSPEEAYAQDTSAEIARLIKGMPDVMDAYGRMRERLSVINQLRDRGVVGEGNRGYLVPRGGLSPDEQRAVNAENGDREIVVKGMARAILKINGLPETSSNLQQVIPQAEKEYAKVKRNASQKGWWVQEADGQWVQR